eukprot:m.4870 g.4870  ORF g.4870 m.4870 type:complete len:65 (-) comp2461_c0_seq2:321-515(-)
MVSIATRIPFFFWFSFFVAFWHEVGALRPPLLNAFISCFHLTQLHCDPKAGFGPRQNDDLSCFK